MRGQNFILVVLNVVLAATSVISITMSQNDGKILYSVPGVIFISEVLKLFVTFILGMLSIIFDPQFFQSHGEERHVDDPIYDESELELFGHKVKRLFLDGLPYIVPAVLYAVANNLTYLVLMIIPPPSYQLLLNARIIVTALLFRVVLTRKLTYTHYAALTMLMCSLGLSRLNLQTSMVVGGAKFIFGVVIMVLIIFFSSFANVYFESIMKKGLTTSIYLQNGYLYFYGILVNLVMYSIRAVIFREDFGDIFHHYNFHVVVSILSNVVLSIVISAVLKYTDTIIHLFANAASVVLVIALNWIFLGGRLTPHFLLAMCVVFIAIFVYLNEDEVHDEKTHHETGGEFEQQRKEMEMYSSVAVEDDYEEEMGPKEDTIGNTSTQIQEPTVQDHITY
jgi:probable UDP-sugar transporter A4